ncbi:unnamed protein product [Larinioides sclopetarius]|uniref:Amino acid transporter transmembrane domain-containing protein n=1 Tax=Larinioides sclopetarius TaxID=280406 RepID=A0AAV2A2W0_9ARAC
MKTVARARILSLESKHPSSKLDLPKKSKKMSRNLTDFTITPPKLKPKRRIDILFLILKQLACVLGPLTIPTIVYGVEGFTTLFWCILGIASFTSFLFLTLDIQKVKDLTEYLKINQCGGIRCLIKVSSMTLVFGGGTYAYHTHLYEVFCVCLFVAGVITGTFLSDITAWWNFRRKKNLPYMNFRKNSPKPVRPSFLNLRRKSLNVSACATNLLPLKRQLSSPTKKSSDYPKLDEAKPPAAVLAETPNVSMRPVLPGYPSSSSSSGDSDGPDTPQQSTTLTPTKRRVISAGLISLSPLATTPKTEPISKRRLEFPGSFNPTPLKPSADNLHLPEIPTFTYTECKVENLLSQNFSFFHM